MNFPLYKIVLDDELSGLIGISIVDEPANEHSFVTLSKDLVKLKATNKEKRILTGVVLIPNQKIYRFNEEEGDHYIYFDKETIEKASHNFLKSGMQKNSWFNHNYNVKLKDNALVESWIISDPVKDKAFSLGFKDLPVGTWMVSYKLSEKDWKDYIKTGKAKGFSIDALFNKQLIKNRKSKMVNKLIKLFKDIVKMETVSYGGKDLHADSFEVGSKVYFVDEEGNEVPFANESFTHDGKIYTTDENGEILSAIDENAEVDVELEDEAGEDEPSFKEAIVEIAKEDEDFKDSLIDAVEELVDEGEIEEDELIEVAMRRANKSTKAMTKLSSLFNKERTNLSKTIRQLKEQLERKPANTRLKANVARKMAPKTTLETLREIANK